MALLNEYGSHQIVPSGTWDACNSMVITDEFARLLDKSISKLSARRLDGGLQFTIHLTVREYPEV